MKLCPISVSAPKAALGNASSALQEEEESEVCSYKKQGLGDSVLHSDCLWCEAPARRRKLSHWLLFCTSSAQPQLPHPFPATVHVQKLGRERGEAGTC